MSPGCTEFFRAVPSFSPLSRIFLCGTEQPFRCFGFFAAIQCASSTFSNFSSSYRAHRSHFRISRGCTRRFSSVFRFRRVVRDSSSLFWIFLCVPVCGGPRHRKTLRPRRRDRPVVPMLVGLPILDPPHVEPRGRVGLSRRSWIGKLAHDGDD